MDFDDEQSGRSAVAAGDPLPPADWAGYQPAGTAQALYTVHEPQLARFFATRAPAQDIGDFVHDVFRRFLGAGAVAVPEQPRAYFLAAARNLLADQHRRAARRMAAAHEPLEEALLPASDPHAQLEARDMLRRAEDAISRLRPITREIFLLHKFDGMAYAEIAAAKGISVKSVEKHIAKALIAVRRTRIGG